MIAEDDLFVRFLDDKEPALDAPLQIHQYLSHLLARKPLDFEPGPVVLVHLLTHILANNADEAGRLF
jgi:hypothetical protein